MPVIPLSSGLAPSSTPEKDRIDDLHSLQILDTEHELEFDELVQLASEVCATPIGLITLLDTERQWFKAAVGTTLTETPISQAFCARAIEHPGLFIVEDAAADPRFCDNPLVTRNPHIRFYAGVPLHVSPGVGLGTLCVIDTVPRTLTPSQQSSLRILAGQVQARLQLRAEKLKLQAALAQMTELSASLKASNAAFRAFMDNGPFASYIKDREGRMLFYNESIARRFNVDRQAWIGKKDAELWPPEMAEKFRELDQRVLAGRTPIVSLEQSPDPDGEAFIQWKSYKFPFQKENGEWMLGGISVDVTREIEREANLAVAIQTQRAQLHELEVSRALLIDFTQNSPNLTFIKSENGHYISYNRAFARHYNITEQEWIGRTDQEVLPAHIADSFFLHDQQVVQSGESVEVRDHFQTPGVGTRTFRSIKFPLRGARGERLIGGISINITPETRKQEALAETNARLNQLASTDVLTGLANRREFDQRMDAEYAAAERRKRPLSLLILDIDNFKQRNDRFGHTAGDHTLRHLGRVLQSAVRSGELAARIGGEEFALLLPDAGAPEAHRIARQIQAALARIQSPSGPITVSIGIASRDFTTRTWRHLLGRSDDAMYAAKRAGKNRIIIHKHLVDQMFAEAKEKSGLRPAAIA